MKVGDVVRLKGQTVDMTVVSMPGTEMGVVTCKWFGLKGDIWGASFALEALEHAPTQSVIEENEEFRMWALRLAETLRVHPPESGDLSMGAARWRGWRERMLSRVKELVSR